jgi:phytanoyl-CoA hydroxylase
MNHLHIKGQIASYQSNGFIVINNFLWPDELEHGHNFVSKAVKRSGKKCPARTLL